MGIEIINNLTRVPTVINIKVKNSLIRPKFKRPYAGVYCITNPINKKKYISAAFDVDRELRAERTRLMIGKHKNANLQKDYDEHKKYGFKFTLIVKFKSKELKGKNVTEQHTMLHDLKRKWIKRLDTRNPDKGYNARAGKKS